jgi:hypothetical protein
MAVLSADPDFVYCLSSACSSGQIHIGDDIFTCTACGHKHCVGCKSDWHPGRTCGGIDAADLDGDGDVGMMDMSDGDTEPPDRKSQEESDGDSDEEVAKPGAQHFIKRRTHAEDDAAKEHKDKEARAEEEFRARRACAIRKRREAEQEEQEEAQRLRVRQEEASSQQKVEETTKPCPNCTRRIEKNG